MVCVARKYWFGGMRLSLETKSESNLAMRRSVAPSHRRIRTILYAMRRSVAPSHRRIRPFSSYDG